MDFSRFKTNDWLVIGGGLGMLIFGTFLDWWKIGGFASGANAFDFFFTGTVPWILLIGAAVVTSLRVQGTIKDGSVPWPMVIAFATLLAAVLLLIRFLFNPGAPGGVDRGVGLILSFLAGLVAAAGGVLSFTAGGGTVADLTNPEKVRAAFSPAGSVGSSAPSTSTAPGFVQSSTNTGKLSVGGWGVAIFFFGWLGGLIGYFSLKDTDPRRASHVMKWGLIFTAIWIVLWVLLWVVLFAALSSTT